MGEIIVNTTFKKYGLNNIEKLVYSLGIKLRKGGIQFSCCKISKTLLFSGKVCSDLIRISG